MIEVGVNETAALQREADGSYRVVLGKIQLPHLPLSREVLAVVNAKEVAGEFGRPSILNEKYADVTLKYQRLTEIRSSRTGMKLSHIDVEYKDGIQVITGRVRSTGPRPNLISYLNEFAPPTLAFGMRALTRPSATHPGAVDIYRVITWDIVSPTAVL